MYCLLWLITHSIIWVYWGILRVIKCCILWGIINRLTLIIGYIYSCLLKVCCHSVLLIYQSSPQTKYNHKYKENKKKCSTYDSTDQCTNISSWWWRFIGIIWTRIIRTWIIIIVCSRRVTTIIVIGRVTRTRIGITAVGRCEDTITFTAGSHIERQKEYEINKLYEFI